MVENRVGCVAVVKDEALVGILTERDLMVKVTDRSATMEDLRVADVMASPVHTIAWDASHTHAAALMLEHHCRHLPVVADDGHLLGMLSIRHVYREQLRRLRGEVKSLESYIGADGPGG
jgi:CBS domain-containing protein